MGAEQARRARARRSAALLDVRERRTTLTDALYDTPDALKTATTWAVLTALPGVGDAKARRVLEECHIWPLTNMCHLTTAQRQSLEEVLTRQGRS